MEENKLREMLDKQIEEEIKALGLMSPGTEDYTRQVENIDKLYRLKMEEDDRIREKENDIKDYIKYGIDAAGIILPLAFYGIWMSKGFKFEQTGTFTSTTFRGLFQKFKPTK